MNQRKLMIIMVILVSLAKSAWGESVPEQSTVDLSGVWTDPRGFDVEVMQSGKKLKMRFPACFFIQEDWSVFEGTVNGRTIALNNTSYGGKYNHSFSPAVDAYLRKNVPFPIKATVSKDCTCIDGIANGYWVTHSGDQVLKVERTYNISFSLKRGVWKSAPGAKAGEQP